MSGNFRYDVINFIRQSIDEIHDKAIHILEKITLDIDRSEIIKTQEMIRNLLKTNFNVINKPEIYAIFIYLLIYDGIKLTNFDELNSKFDLLRLEKYKIYNSELVNNEIEKIKIPCACGQKVFYDNLYLIFNYKKKIILGGCCVQKLGIEQFDEELKNDKKKKENFKKNYKKMTELEHIIRTGYLVKQITFDKVFYFRKEKKLIINELKKRAERMEQLMEEIKLLKAENTKLKNRIRELENIENTENTEIKKCNCGNEISNPVYPRCWECEQKIPKKKCRLCPKKIPLNAKYDLCFKCKD